MNVLNELQKCIEDGYFYHNNIKYPVSGTFEFYELKFIERKVSMTGQHAIFLDIGVGKGFTSVLGANQRTTIGIDPFQLVDHNNSVFALAEKLRIKPPSIIVKKSIAASQDIESKLDKLNSKVELALVDGDHRFDSTIVDLNLCMELLVDDGIILVDDCYYTQKLDAVSYFLRHYDLTLVSTKLKNRNFLTRVARFMKHWFRYRWRPKHVFLLLRSGVPFSQDSYLFELRKNSTRKTDYFVYKGM